MRFLLILLIAILGICDAFQFDLSLAPGLSVKNGLIYLAAMLIVLRMMIGGTTKLETAGVEIVFVVLIGYAMLTWLIAGLAIGYTGYDMVASGILLKSSLIDQAIFFFVFFHAVNNREDALIVTKTLAAVLGFTSLVTVLAVFGGVDLGIATVDDSGGYENRVMGTFGNPNRTGAFIVVFLPLLVATLYASRGWRLIGWLIAVACTLTVLLATTSRGSFVGMILGGILAFYLCRKHISAARVVGLLAAFFVVIVLAVIVLASFGYGDVLSERLVGRSTAVDLGEISSGRTEIWREAVGRMLETPTTLLTGFGWNAYESMAFRYAPHSYYLWLWFDLGLIGVGCFLLMMRRSVMAAVGALDTADPAIRPYLLAFLFGVLTIPVTAIFGHLTGIWVYIWAYIGVTMRLVYLADTTAHTAAVKPTLKSMRPLRP